MSTVPLPSLALPGQLLGPRASHIPGPGTHIHGSCIHASIAGPVSSTLLARSSSLAPARSKNVSLLSIVRTHPQRLVCSERGEADYAVGMRSSVGIAGAALLPEVGATVLCRITKLGQRFANADILALPSPSTTLSGVGTSAPIEEPPIIYSTPHPAIIRREDIRSMSKDTIQVAASFGIGDIVRGVVISLGDTGGYYLSTEGNECGVVMAWSSDVVGGEGERVMWPISWKEVWDPVSGAKEARKVARPF